MGSVVSMRWVLARLYEPDLAIVDCRFVPGDPEAGRRSYEESYIPGAIYMDLERDLSGPVGDHGGRHPLPDVAELAAKLGRAGIDRSMRVVAYDDQGGAMAARFWWLLRYMGHERVYVMDQGFSAWKRAGFPVAKAAPPIRVPKTYVPDVRPEMLADVEDVRRAADTGDSVLVDSREPARYRGDAEPIDRAAGHIPGAVNRFWKENLDEAGRWRGPDELAARFASLPKDKPVIVYCGWGVTACPNVLALLDAGYRDVKLYAGSWSDWISYPENPVTKGEEQA
jgi:thiosulfate/3-mercaptopyruvate sulfurtransferase